MNGTFNLGGSQFELTDERQDRVADIASQIAIHKQSGHRVWIKSIPKYSTRNLKKNAWMKGDDGGLNQQITEIHLILAISKLLPRHPNVGNLIGITETDNFYYCVTELPSSSSVTLASFLQSTRSISEKEIFVIFHQILVAVSIFHHHMIWHSELSVENVFVDKFMNVQVQNIGVSLLYQHEHSPSTHLYGGTGAFSFLDSNIAIDLRQVGLLTAALAMGRTVNLPLNPAQQKEAPVPIETLLAEVPVSGKLKHLISRMIGSEVLKRFGIQDIISHPWYRAMAASYATDLPPYSVMTPAADGGVPATPERGGGGLGGGGGRDHTFGGSGLGALGPGGAARAFGPSAAITQSYNYNDPIRPPGAPMMCALSYLGMPKGIINSLSSREVNHVKIFVARALHVLSILSEEEKELYNAQYRDLKIKSPTNRTPPPPFNLEEEDDDEGRRDDLLIKPLRFGPLIEAMRMKKRRELQKKRLQRRSTHSELTIRSFNFSPETLGFDKPSLFFRHTYGKISRRCLPILNLEEAQPILPSKTLKQMRKTYDQRFWQQFVPGSIPAYFPQPQFDCPAPRKAFSVIEGRGEFSKKVGRPKASTSHSKLQTKERAISPPNKTISPSVRSPKGKVLSPRDKKSSPKGKVLTPRDKKSSPKGKVLSPRDKKSSPKGKGLSPRDKKSSPKAISPGEKGNRFSPKEKGKGKDKEKDKKEKSEDKEKEKHANFLKHFPIPPQKFWFNLPKLMINPYDVEPTPTSEGFEKTVERLNRVNPSRGDLRSTFFKGSRETPPELELAANSNLKSNIDKDKMDQFLPVFSQLVPPHRPLRRRSNSTSSLFVSWTIDTLNLKEIVKCGSYALHLIVRYCHINAHNLDPLDIFNEAIHPLIRGAVKESEVPHPKTIFDFCYGIMTAEDVRGDVMIVCVSLVERLVFRNKLMFGPLTWRRLLFGLLLISTKYWEELSIWNSDFQSHVPLADIEELQSLEMALLKLLNFDVIVAGRTFTKYYFALRALSRAKDVVPRTELRLLDTKNFYEQERTISGNAREKKKRTKSILGCNFVHNANVALN